MSFPNNYKYTKDHEWALVEGNTVTVGVTAHAASALGDIVYVELPEVGRTLKHGETFGVVESIKAVSDLYSPISGKVTASNAALVNEPAMINQDPHGKAWMVKMELTDASTLNNLMDAAAYNQFVATLK
ncbi:MAG TPA: glycine cleavage system protein GcvH [Bdellovibrionales bacterium]|nr:MAG: glycine cleavage system protein H [Bdellovibrionales bacterium GWB1_52_6]OFZ04395.1 MAG: glycine cleavage system protein H [Bdellovibrionales bacterium GWA1_52_35]HAR42096.1 glycine cleavage system protein GcvH [Bdellovibrionales bacterium]HCM40749.1 glycine cleavage system protein GcvH [Bdellovibrionales bacterium]